MTDFIVGVSHYIAQCYITFSFCCCCCYTNVTTDYSTQLNLTNIVVVVNEHLWTQVSNISNFNVRKTAISRMHIPVRMRGSKVTDP